MQSHLLDKLKSTQTFHAARFSGRSRREGEKKGRKGDEKKKKKRKKDGWKKGEEEWLLMDFVLGSDGGWSGVGVGMELGGY